MNRIPEIQNEQTQLDRLAAQRYLYSCSKKMLIAQVILGGPVVIAWSVLTLWLPDLKGIAALWGVTVFLCDITWFNSYQKMWRERAAKIQGQFDCDVLGLPWNDIKAGDPPTPEEVHENAEKYARHASRKPPLANWYPPVVGELPLVAARIICQRTNCWWDGKQRNRYAQCALGLAIGVFLILIWVFFMTDSTLPNFVLKVVFPALPAATIGLRQWNEHRDSASRLDTLRRHADSLWKQALLGADELTLTSWSRQLQDEIFQGRKSNPPVFDSWYALLQPKTEAQMQRSTKDLVDEWQRARNRG